MTTDQILQAYFQHQPIAHHEIVAPGKWKSITLLDSTINPQTPLLTNILDTDNRNTRKTSHTNYFGYPTVKLAFLSSSDTHTNYVIERNNIYELLSDIELSAYDIGNEDIVSALNDDSKAEWRFTGLDIQSGELFTFLNFTRQKPIEMQDFDGDPNVCSPLLVADDLQLILQFGENCAYVYDTIYSDHETNPAFAEHRCITITEIYYSQKTRRLRIWQEERDSRYDEACEIWYYAQR